MASNTLLVPERLDWMGAITCQKVIYAITEKKGFFDLVVDFSRTTKAYANGVVPLIAMLDRLRQLGYEVEIIPPKEVGLFITHNWLHHLDPEAWPQEKPLSEKGLVLQRFSSESEMNDLITHAVEVCLQQLKFEKGVPDAFEWALCEIAGNILVHAECTSGWFEVSPFPKNRQLAIVVCDTGIGIPASMKKAFHPKDDLEAIEMALRKGITSKPNFGQGNGLAGALSIAQHSRGLFRVTSGLGTVGVNAGKVTPEKHYPAYDGTCVELQFSTDKPIDITAALWGHKAVGHVELKFEDDQGDLVVDLREYASSFGNRITGEKLRTLLLNLLKQNPGHPMRIEMGEIRVIASSFADELFGKMFVELGAVDFSRLIKLANINPTCKGIIDVAVMQRVMQFQQSTPTNPAPERPAVE